MPIPAVTLNSQAVTCIDAVTLLSFSYTVNSFNSLKIVISLLEYIRLIIYMYKRETMYWSFRGRLQQHLNNLFPRHANFINRSEKQLLCLFLLLEAGFHTAALFAWEKKGSRLFDLRLRKIEQLPLTKRSWMLSICSRGRWKSWIHSTFQSQKLVAFSQSRFANSRKDICTKIFMHHQKQKERNIWIMNM